MAAQNTDSVFPVNYKYQDCAWTGNTVPGVSPYPLTFTLVTPWCFYLNSAAALQNVHTVRF